MSDTAPQTENVFSVPNIEEYIKQLNTQVDSNEGEWIYVAELDEILWRPVIGDDAGGTPSPTTPEPNTPPPALVELVRWGKQIDFDNIPKNAVILIKLNTSDPYHVQMMQQVIARQVLQPRVKTLKEKSICVMFMGSDDDITVLTEEDMNKAGWEKKEKSLIIIPR